MPNQAAFWRCKIGRPLGLANHEARGTSGKTNCSKSTKICFQGTTTAGRVNPDGKTGSSANAGIRPTATEGQRSCSPTNDAFKITPTGGSLHTAARRDRTNDFLEGKAKNMNR